MLLLEKPPATRSALPPGRCLLFAYGQLQPGLHEPRTALRAWPDRVRGLLFDLGPYPAAVQVGLVERWFHGYVLDIAESELVDDLDEHEDVDNGLYRRIRTYTESGHEVWVYVYAQPLPHGVFGPIDRWIGPRKPRA